MASDDGSWDEEAALSQVLPADGGFFHDKKGRPVALPEAPAPLADSHGHLTAFQALDPAVALARAALAGVRLLVVPIDPADEIARLFPSAAACLSWLDEQLDHAHRLLDAVAARGAVPPAPAGWEGTLPDLLDDVFIVAGAHPYSAPNLAGAWEALGVLLDSPRCVGVGEIGLDVGPWCEVPLAVQEQAFRAQLRLACERGLPVELHLRDGAHDTLAHDRATSILEEEGVPEAGCDLHCFTAGPEVMVPFLELGCHVAFGGAATFARSDEIRAAAAACPHGRILSETDSPYMAPAPLRGTECEPAMVALSAARVAEVREDAGVAPRAATYRDLWENARTLFGL